MKKYHLLFIACSLVFSMFIFWAFGIFLIKHMSGMNDLPNGDYIESYESPNGEYVVNSYLCSGNATVDFAVRCEAVNNKTGDTRNIYWEYHFDTADVSWVDENTVLINGHYLNVITDSYDWREYI